MLRNAILAIGGLIAVVVWCALAAYFALLGWWMNPIAPEGDADGFFAEARRIIEERNPGNTAFVLVEGGVVHGQYYAKASRGVDGDTVFPTASLSKWITAFGVMRLVEDGRIGLDMPVQSYLTRWRLPDGPFNDEVTVRRLLSHTAGLGDGLGFGDYAADEEPPTIEQSLTNPRASRGGDVRIAVVEQPGDSYDYSGGGFLILQLLIEEVSGQEFASFMSETLFSPLGMTSSSYEFIGDVARATGSFSADGTEAPQYKYAAGGATGFSSSASDLLRLAIAVMNSDASLGLSATTLEAMRAPEARLFGVPIWGLGTILYAPTGGGDHVFGHDGLNEPAINASVRINPATGDAVIMLANGGSQIASQIGSEWTHWQTGLPDILSTGRSLKSALVPAGAGSALILALFGYLIFPRPRT